jgi:hypothetical protein
LEYVLGSVGIDSNALATVPQGLAFGTEERLASAATDPRTARMVTEVGGSIGEMGGRLGSVAKSVGQSVALNVVTAGGLGGGIWVPASRVARRRGSIFTYLGQNPIFRDSAWARYQEQEAGPAESVFTQTSPSGKVRLISLDTVQPDGLAVEVKRGDMGQLYNLDRRNHILQQSSDYLNIASAFKLPGVQYRVSTELGASRLITVFTWLHPEELRSGFLAVRWYPSLIK